MTWKKRILGKLKIKWKEILRKLVLVDIFDNKTNYIYFLFFVYKNIFYIFEYLKWPFYDISAHKVYIEKNIKKYYYKTTIFKY